MEWDRVTITLLTTGGLVLLWLAWQLYKAKTLRTLEIGDAVRGKPNLLYFTAQYCAACKFQQTPIIETIAARLGDSVAIKKVDVTEHPELARQYKILTLPTTIVVDHQGQVRYINRGVAAKEQLEAQLQS